MNKNGFIRISSIWSSRQKEVLRGFTKGKIEEVVLGKTVDWSLQSYLPSGDSRGLSGKLPH